MNHKDKNSGYLTGQMLVAMPSLDDPSFHRAVVYICAHNENGAMGIIINREIDDFSFSDVLSQMDLPSPLECQAVRLLSGGPVESSRGFVLHSTDYLREHSLKIDDNLAITATLDILRDISAGLGPSRYILALGHAGWKAGQLDGEVLENTWLTVPADQELIFSPNIAHKWEKAIAKLGCDPVNLCSEAGHA